MGYFHGILRVGRKKDPGRREAGEAHQPRTIMYKLLKRAQ